MFSCCWPLAWPWPSACTVTGQLPGMGDPDRGAPLDGLLLMSDRGVVALGSSVWSLSPFPRKRFDLPGPTVFPPAATRRQRVGACNWICQPLRTRMPPALHRRRRSKGFERAGRLGLAQLSLDLPRARELVLSHAWREIAGGALSQRVQATKVQRGVLELEVSDSRWAETIAGLAPRLAGRLAARHPELGVRRFRLCRPGASHGRPQPVSEEESREADPEAGLRPAHPGSMDTGFTTAERLQRLMVHYLARKRKG